MIHSPTFPVPSACVFQSERGTSIPGLVFRPITVILLREGNTVYTRVAGGRETLAGVIVNRRMGKWLSNGTRYIYQCRPSRRHSAMGLPRYWHGVHRGLGT